MKQLDEVVGAVGGKRGQVVEQKVVNLALQGGGSHGAFSWGVLDRLLEEEQAALRRHHRDERRRRQCGCVG